MDRRQLIPILVFLSSGLLAQETELRPLANQQELRKTQREKSTRDPNALGPLPQKVPEPKSNLTTPAKVELGKMLFFDPRLSGDNKMSCASCHMPSKAFGDGLPVSPGANGKPLKRNTQTCLNVGYLKSFFWDGRARSLEEQALVPIQSSVEMNQDLDALEKELRAIPGYVTAFEKAFRTAPNRDGIAKALATFQRSLVTAASPFDRYLAGDKQALSEEAKQGFELFRGDAGCIRCHNGPLLSDGKFYRLGVSHTDEGRSKITEKKEDLYRFRTPTLRNVAETGPYMHDGSLRTLDDVVMFYYRGVPESSPNGLTPDLSALSGQSFSEIPLLVAFLKSLSSNAPNVVAPRLP